MKNIIGIVSLILCAGCLTWTPSPQDAASAVALVAPQYAGAVSMVTSTAKSKASAPALDGFTYREVYRYKGTVCDAADVTMERIYSQTLTGAEVFAAKPIPPVVTPSQDASTPSTNTTTATTDEQAADRIAEALDKLIPPAKKEKK